MPVPERSPFTSSERAPESGARRVPVNRWSRFLRRAERKIAQGQYEEAVDSLKQARSAGADGCYCTLRIAEVYQANRQWPAALDAAEEAASLAPEHLAVQEKYREIALEAGDRKRIVAACLRCIKLAPRSIPAYTALGAAYFEMGQSDAALRTLNTLIRLDGLNPAHRFKKALICQHQGEVSLAVREFAEALRMEPEGPYAAAAREALETLDAFQINQILTLAVEDVIFRAHLLREPGEAAEGRGFTLSERGVQALGDICQPFLSEMPAPPRLMQYQ